MVEPASTIDCSGHELRNYASSGRHLIERVAAPCASMLRLGSSTTPMRWTIYMGGRNMDSPSRRSHNCVVRQGCVFSCFNHLGPLRVVGLSSSKLLVAPEGNTCIRRKWHHFQCKPCDKCCVSAQSLGFSAGATHRSVLIGPSGVVALRPATIHCLVIWQVREHSGRHPRLSRHWHLDIWTSSTSFRHRARWRASVGPPRVVVPRQPRMLSSFVPKPSLEGVG